MTAIDSSKQQAFDPGPKAILKISFTGNLSGNNNRLMRILQFYFVLIQYQYKMTQYNTLNLKLSN